MAAETDESVHKSFSPLEQEFAETDLNDKVSVVKTRGNGGNSTRLEKL